MAKVLVLYYSMYGHTESMAEAEAEGVRTVADVEVKVKRVPEILPEDTARAMGVKLAQQAPVATTEELAEYDAIIFGSPTRFGNMSAQMINFLDQTCKLWEDGALAGKVASVFTRAATPHGGLENTVSSFHSRLQHHGMMIVGESYFNVMTEITGEAPYDASGTRHEHKPRESELEIARFQGRHVAQVARCLAQN